MSKIFIIHGAYGNTEENWIPWLREELEKLGHRVIVPQFPTPENQNLENWLNVINDYEADFNNDTVMVGHSIGASFILNFLSRRRSPIRAAFLVAGFVSDLGISQFREINDSFLREFDWEKIKSNCSNFSLMYSDNDPYVSLDRAKEVSSKLNVDLLLVPGAGHFNSDAGYNKFELLLEKVKSVL